MKTLKQFYRELQAWIDDGCPEHEVFKTSYGLCYSLDRWSGCGGELSRELGGQFINAGLARVYPFNTDEYNFDDEVDDETIYKNPARLAWIKEHAS